MNASLSLLSPTLINAIYTNHVVKEKDYFTKYESLPLEEMHESWRWEDHDFARIMALLDFREWIVKHDLRSEKLLATDDTDPELIYLPQKERITLEYDIKTNRNDLHTLNHQEKDFDFCVFNQTLEHLHTPVVAVSNIINHLRPGGYIYTSVPTVCVPHMTPIHFWGMTPVGLACLFASFGMKIIETGQWGSRKYIEFLFWKRKWPDYRDMQDANGLIQNEEGNPCHCWILVQKPLS
jgi:SAM-dependent methyltransferase